MRWIFTLLLVLGSPCGVVFASIPRHEVSPNRANSLSPLAPHPNSEAGKLAGLGDPWGTGGSAGVYENAGRLVSWTDHHGVSVQYGYDKAGAVTNISYPGNLTVTYTWDAGGRLAAVKDWGSREWTFSYDGANRLTGISYPNGVNYSRAYNADGQVTNYVHAKGGTAFVSRGLERNAAGLKTREIIAAGLEAEPPDTWQRHASDKGDRLTGLSRRDEYVLPERWRNYVPGYSGEGQVTNLSESYQGQAADNQLAWDAAGRLTSYSGLRSTNLWMNTPPMPGEGLFAVYDGLGARTARTDDSVAHRFVVDRVGRLNVPLAELDASNAAVRYYVWAPGVGLLAQVEASSGAVLYFHADENGSTLALTDGSGNVTDQFAYSPWGELLGRTGTNTTLFTFVGGGGVTWEGGALYRMGARYYDARLKRWLSADPIGMAGGANLYLYANANPLYWVDVLGLCGEGPTQARQLYWQQGRTSRVPPPSGEIRNPASIAELNRATTGSFGRPPMNEAEMTLGQMNLDAIRDAMLVGVPVELAAGAIAARVGSMFRSLLGDGAGASTAYRAIDSKYAQSTLDNGFYRSGGAGRLGNDGIYANS